MIDRSLCCVTQRDSRAVWVLVVTKAHCVLWLDCLPVKVLQQQTWLHSVQQVLASLIKSVFSTSLAPCFPVVSISFFFIRFEYG